MLLIKQLEYGSRKMFVITDVPKLLICLSKQPVIYETRHFDIFRDFKKDKVVEVQDLSKTIVRQILAKSVVTLFAHLGYESIFFFNYFRIHLFFCFIASHQSVLDVLTDILQEFYRKICYRVKIAINDEEKYHYSGFPVKFFIQCVFFLIYIFF